MNFGTEAEIIDALDAAYQAGYADGITDGLAQKTRTETHANPTHEQGKQ